MIGRAAVAGLAITALALTGAAPGASAQTDNHRQAQRIEALRHFTAGDRDIQHAQNFGYRFFTDTKGVACIAMPGMGAMGVHFVFGKRVANPAEGYRRPEAMVYRIDKAGQLRLAAVEYVTLASAWQAHHKGVPRLFGQRFSLTPAGNRYGLPAYYSLHAWVWYHNPAGMFAPYNPRVHC